MNRYDICVVGLGYIGLPTALLFAEAGKRVLGYDISQKTVDKINACESGKNEQGLNELLVKNMKGGNLTVDTNPDYADVYLISVPTPFKDEMSPDLSYIQSAMSSIIPFISKGCSVILESTSPVGTTDEYICSRLIEKGYKPGEDVYVAYSPERVLPGNILYELIHNDRILGGVTKKSCDHIVNYYKLFVKGDILLTDAKTAEMCKLMENAYRDVNIAFANEMSKMCEEAGINAWEVQQLCNRHPRVNILKPGPGVGGHCIAVDPWFLVSRFPEQTLLIAQGRKINDSMPLFAVKKIMKIQPVTKNTKIAVLGFTYKPDVDDIRESPVLKIIALLKEEGYNVSVHDPFVAEGVYDNTSIEDCLKDADLMLLGVDHKVFKQTDLNYAYGLMRNKVILDTRNFLNLEKAKQIGFKCYLLGEGLKEG